MNKTSLNKQLIINTFAANVRAERARKKYTQVQLAERAEITPEYLARIEAGKFSPSLVVIVNLALSLEVPIDRLITL